jgi:hypothetical protein
VCITSARSSARAGSPRTPTPTSIADDVRAGPRAGASPVPRGRRRLRSEGPDR